MVLQYSCNSTLGQAKKSLKVLSVIIISYAGGDLVTKSCPTLAIPWTIVRQAPLSMGFPRKEYKVIDQFNCFK